MTRKDYDVLAAALRDCLKAESLTEGGFASICAELDKNFSNFNRSRFEKECRK